jgi:hypothetical protein
VTPNEKALTIENTAKAGTEFLRRKKAKQKMVIHPDHKFLIDSALWVVIDPWDLQPGLDPDHRINYINNYYCAMIDYYLNKFVIKHKCISLDEEKYTRSSYFKTYSNMTLREQIIDYLSKYQLQNVVYTGFHNGLCIIDKDTGVKSIKKDANVYIKKDLVCTLGYTVDHKYPFELRDGYNEKHCNNII